MYNTINLNQSKATTIFFVKNESVESANQYDFIMSYMEKSSLGTGNCIIEELYNEDKDIVEYVLFKLIGWTASQSKKSVHNNYEDAEQAMLDSAYYDYEAAPNYTPMYDSYEDAYKALIIDYADCNEVSIEVATSIVRKKEIIRKSMLERKKESEEKRKSAKSALEEAVIEEASSIVIDSEFSASISEAELKNNTEKVRLQVVAMKRLLEKKQ